MSKLWTYHVLAHCRRTDSDRPIAAATYRTALSLSTACKHMLRRCMAHAGYSLYVTMGREMPPNAYFPEGWGIPPST